MQPRKHIVILEDDHRRRVEMFRWLDDRLWMYEPTFFRTAPDMAAWLDTNWGQVLVASLDHDLEDLPENSVDRSCVGTGRDVADAIVLLGKGREHFPVLIHSTNAPASHGMLESLRDADWYVDRISPYNDLEWIEKDWYPTLKRLIPIANQVIPNATHPLAEARAGNPAA